MLGIIGPNGAGKSTLLKLIAGILKPSGGAVTLFGRPMAKIPLRRRAAEVAFLPQSPPTPGEITAGEVVLLGRFPRRRYRFFDSAEDGRIATEAMRITETSEFSDRPMRTLSAGERQRVHVAAALVQDPRLLILDEPTSALDPYHQLQIFALLRRLIRETGLSLIVVTHDINLASQACDRIALLSRGRIAAAGGVDDVVRPERLREVYGVEFARGEFGPGLPSWVLPLPPNVTGAT
jgi:iron complex transport system ATP-binding protein